MFNGDRFALHLYQLSYLDSDNGLMKEESVEAINDLDAFLQAQIRLGNCIIEVRVYGRLVSRLEPASWQPKTLHVF